MAERLIIRNFAGIDEIDIELGRINIFIGAQASGKSICVKCLYYFKGCINSLLRQAIQPRLPVENLDSLFEAGFSVMFDETAFQSNSILRYSDGENFIQIVSNGRQIKATYSNFYADLFNRARKAVTSRVASSPEEEAFSDTAIYVRFKQAAAQALGTFGTSTLLFVPASRAAYSLVGEPRSDDQFSIDPFVNNFRPFYAAFKRSESLARAELRNSIIKRLTAEVLQAEFLRLKEDEFIIQVPDTPVPLSVASSGQQEVLPVVLTLRYLALAARIEPEIAIIEEPEAHLHPTAQNALAQLMSAVYNTRKAPLQLFLTTHTPYLLTAFNNLIYAGQLADTLQDDAPGLAKLEAVVPKELRLNLADFRVYGLENGRATLMIDEETGLLRADSLDSVSDVTADQFGDLMALDPAIHS
ncbi:AAA family ATPase [Hymenobacter rubidus]|uniref:AAA family ATPase n=1 Tax=Hymenobacter rubidus TaxID=1441626 RepID=UPI00191D0E00|nr:AAA family ATPase [Hymenobacter rubidus]